MSNVGKWNDVYKDLGETPDAYDIVTDSFETGANWLKDCDTVEDWGCGKGYFSSVCKTNCVSVDGSNTRFADKIVDLAEYKTEVEGIFMRSVAEHNFEWEKILKNLAESFTKKAFVQFYTPMNTETDKGILLIMSPGYDNIPEISIPTSVWHKILEDNKIKWTVTKVDSLLAYEEETYYFLEK